MASLISEYNVMKPIVISLVEIDKSSYIWNIDRDILEIILNILTDMHLQMAHVYNKINHIYGRLAMNPNNYKYYMKGGNAIELLKTIYSADSTVYFPSDFDYTILVNPHLSTEVYNWYQTILIQECLQMIFAHCLNKSNWAPFMKYVENNKTNPLFIHYDDTFYKNDREIDKYPNKSLNEIEKIFNKPLPKECPFQIIIQWNTVYDRKLLNVGVIKVCLKNRSNTELFDISFILKNDAYNTVAFNNIKREWNLLPRNPLVEVNDRFLIERQTMEGKILYTPVNFRSYIYNIIPAYINLKIAYKYNSRNNKKTKRHKRLQNLKPLLRYQPPIDSFLNSTNTNRNFLINNSFI